MPSLDLLVKRLGPVLHRVDPAEALLAVQEGGAVRRLAADPALGHLQHEVPVLVPEQDLLRIAHAGVEHASIKQ
jgi:hypothetical protein